MVFDEAVATWLVLALVPPTLAWQALGVALFRFFDIVKPVPIKRIETAFKGGFGVMADDVVAAFYALLGVAITMRMARFIVTGDFGAP